MGNKKRQRLAPADTTRSSTLRTDLLLALGLTLLAWLALLRAESVLTSVLLVTVGLWGIFVRESLAWKRALVPWVLVGVGWILAVAPWTVRNAYRLTQFNESFEGRLAEPVPTFVPLTIYGPLNLALANRPDADGTFSAAPVTAAVRWMSSCPTRGRCRGSCVSSWSWVGSSASGGAEDGDAGPSPSRF